MTTDHHDPAPTVYHYHLPVQPEGNLGLERKALVVREADGYEPETLKMTSRYGGLGVLEIDGEPVPGPWEVHVHGADGTVHKFVGGMEESLVQR